MKKIISLTLILLILSNPAPSPLLQKPTLLHADSPIEINKDSLLLIAIDNYYNKIDDSLFNTLKAHIKQKEGCRLIVYNCSAGKKTIGYGHVIINDQDSHLKNEITQHQADSLLIIDLKTIIKITKKITNLNGYRLYAMSAFAFNFGPYYINSNKCDLLKLINANEPIDNEIIKYSKYKSATTGKYVYSKWLYASRLWELQMYNNKHDSLVQQLRLD